MERDKAGLSSATAEAGVGAVMTAGNSGEGPKGGTFTGGGCVLDTLSEPIILTAVISE